MRTKLNTAYAVALPEIVITSGSDEFRLDEAQQCSMNVFSMEVSHCTVSYSCYSTLSIHILIFKFARFAFLNMNT